MSGAVRLVCLVWCAVLAATVSNATSINDTNTDGSYNKLLVILIDGLRWDSINTTHSSPCTKDGKEDMCSNPGSYFTAAQREGSTAAWNTPVFPTTTLPNIFTIATGLLPAHHGVLGTPEQGWGVKEGVTPVWDTAADVGKKVALLRVLGCTTPLPLVTCLPHIPLEGRDNLLVALEGDVALASELLLVDEYDLVIMRTDILSWAAEHYGPSTDALRDILQETETILDALFTEIKQAGKWDETNVVITSSNGLTSTSPGSTTEVSIPDCLSEFPDQPRYRYHSAGSMILAPQHNTTGSQVLEALQACVVPEVLPAGAVTWHLRTELPATDKWRGSDEEIIVVAAPGYVLQQEPRQMQNTSENEHSWYPGEHLHSGREGGRGVMAGSGYDTITSDMNGVFVVKGTGILVGITGGAVLQTDVYQLLCHLAGLQPNTNQGQPETVEWMLKKSAATTTQALITLLAAAVTTALSARLMLLQ